GSLGKQAARITVGQGAYTGLALATNGGKQYLYAANFATGHIDVWGSDWVMKTTFPFHDSGIPKGYSPFNVQNVAGNLFVTYAKVDPVTHRSEAGVGKGFVDIFSPAGILIKRFASMGTLNAPWGVTVAPKSFFHQEMDENEDDDHHTENQNYILIGNFGDGRINAYKTDGKFVGQLRGKKDPIVIEGLWALVFPPSTSTINPDRLYFTAGPDDETHGLFGYLIAKDDD
ncbi:MAG: TIGR03118 family protein, partial [Bacteroidota bacterium]|nr:TIGR03118 family protein [Bacteroidota bacterium]